MQKDLKENAQMYFNPQLARAFALSAEHTMHNSIQQRIVMGQPEVKSDFAEPGDFIGTMMMTTPDEQTQFKVEISFKKETAMYLLEKLLGMSSDSNAAPVRDLVGEMTNMIYCHARKILNQKGATYQMGVPKVRSAADPNPQPEGQLHFVIPFVLAGSHELWVKISAYPKVPAAA